MAEEETILRNRVIPQLYPVFPYGIYCLGQPDLDVVINTWKYGLDQARGSWLAYPQKEEWDVDFKLHATGNTTVECVYEQGEITRKTILPDRRKEDVVMGYNL